MVQYMYNLDYKSKPSTEDLQLHLHVVNVADYYAMPQLVSLAHNKFSTTLAAYAQQPNHTAEEWKQVVAAIEMAYDTEVVPAHISTIRNTATLYCCSQSATLFPREEFKALLLKNVVFTAALANQMMQWAARWRKWQCTACNQSLRLIEGHTGIVCCPTCFNRCRLLLKIG